MAKQVKSGSVKQSAVSSTLALRVVLMATLFVVVCGVAWQSVQAVPLNLPPNTTVSADTNYQGGAWSSGTLAIDPTRTATLDGPPATYTFTLTGSTKNLNGGGTLSNMGTIDHSLTSNYISLTASTTIDNHGIYNFNNANARVHMSGANGFRNLGGTINANATGTYIDGNSVFTTYDGSTLHDLNLVVAPGADFRLLPTGAGGQVQLGTVTIPATSAATFSTPATYTNSGGGDIVFNQPGMVTLGAFVMGTNVVLDAGGNHGMISGTLDTNGFDITNEAGRILTLTGGTKPMSGGGSVINKGTFNHDLSSNYISLTTGTTFDNHGIYNLNSTNSRVHMSGANGFRNLGGTINANATGTYIDGNSVFTTYDGSTLHDLNLVVAPGADFRLLPTGAGGQVQLGTVTIPATSAATFSTPATYTNSGGGDIVFNQPGMVTLGAFTMGANVVLDAGGNHGMISGTLDTNGFDITNETGRTLTLTGGIKNMTGGGSVINKGIFNHDLSSNYISLTTGTTFDNHGIYNLNSTNSRVHMSGANGFRNLGGTINANATGTYIDGNSVFTTYDGSTLHDLNLVVAPGADFRLLPTGAGGQVQLGTVTIPATSAATFSTPATYTNSGGGDIVFNQPGMVTLGAFGMGTNVVLDAGGDHAFITGTINNGGFNLTQETDRTLEMTGGIKTFTGTGKLINNGTMNHDLNYSAPGNIYLSLTGGTTLENVGIYNLVQENSRVHMQGGNQFRNLGGTLTKDSSTTYARLDGGSLDNTGTILVPGGELEIQNSTAFSQFSAGSLTAGTYVVDSTATGTSQLDIQAANAGITTIANGATVKLIGPAADFVQLTNTLANLDGVFSLENGHQFTVDNLTMSGLAEMQFGLLDTSSSNAELTVTNALIANGFINILDSGGFETGLYDLINFSGELTDMGLMLGSLPGAFSGMGFEAELIVPLSGTIGGVIQLNIFEVPEPSSLMLLGLGMVGMAARRRKMVGRRGRLKAAGRSRG